jgi:hypothetical protein
MPDTCTIISIVLPQLPVPLLNKTIFTVWAGCIKPNVKHENEYQRGLKEKYWRVSPLVALKLAHLQSLRRLQLVDWDEAPLPPPALGKLLPSRLPPSLLLPDPALSRKRPSI